ncbi:DNA-binding transcriptional LysR family regulator [Paeniglutamicibacter psychrophenolicus]|nr:DNA-binding transcriptional LysR family regulator [Paeniglutamicibacter psychrophenolicus]
MAAAELGYTVGAISQQMQALQHEAGAALFIKDGRKLVLSDAGHLLLKHALGIIAADEEADQALGDLSDGISSTVRVGVFGSSALMCVSPAIATLALEDPHIRVLLQEIDPEAAVEAVRSGLVDIALCLEYSDLPISGGQSLNQQALVTEPLLVVAHEGFPEQGVGSSEAGFLPGELSEGHEWLLPHDRSLFGQTARRLVAEMTSGYVKTHVVTDTALALALSSAGHGLTIATQSMLDFHRNPVRTLFVSSLERTLVLLAKNASLQRPSARLVHQALVRAGRDFSEAVRSQGDR